MELFNTMNLKNTSSKLSEPMQFSAEITAEDEKIFFEITSSELSEEQVERIRHPDQIYGRQQEILAVHWHPEFVNMDLIDERISGMFPNASENLIIPTQHNVIMNYSGYSGVEVDCYSPEFNLKVQLLAHFREDRVKDAHTLKSMLSYTFRYRQSQLFEYIELILKPASADLISEADEPTIRFVQIQTEKLLKLIEKYESVIPVEALRNKLLRNFFDGLRSMYNDELINRSQNILRLVKNTVKKQFSPEYFYTTRNIIEEVRSLGGGIVIPHPEQFWPILLADYDVDGYEVWNPQSQQYTDFLVGVVTRYNHARHGSGRPLLIFMGDDTHMGEKTKELNMRDPEKGSREIGYQPAWDDLHIKKSLISAGYDRKRVISEYKSRLDS
jgi:hypothetical protein